MSLQACPECQNQISDEAEICPHCGKKLSHSSGGIGCGVVVLLAGLVIVVLSQMGKSTPKTGDPIDLPASARGACRDFILQALNDPASAEFVGLSTDAYAAPNPDGTWTVQRRVRAKNAFGGVITSLFECRMRLNGEAWYAIYVNQQ